jgi:flagellar capping protein FliD
LDDKIESLAGVKKSLLVSRASALQSRIDTYQERIDSWNVRLAKKKDSLLLKFYRLEDALGKMQSSISAVSSIQAIPPLGTAQ